MTRTIAPRLALAALAASFIPAAVLAQENTLSFNAGLVSDYRYRGLSQSDLDPAAQGGFDYAHKSGLYVGAWASTIKWLPNTRYELDIYGGFKGELRPGLGYDVGVLNYHYDGSTVANTTEIYGALTFGMFTAKYSHAMSNLFGFANSKNSSYLDLSATVDLGGGLTLVPHVGRQMVKNQGASSYTDYALSLNKDLGKGLTATVSYIGTNAGKTAYRSVDGLKFTGSNRLVAGVKYTF